MNGGPKHRRSPVTTSRLARGARAAIGVARHRAWMLRGPAGTRDAAAVRVPEDAVQSFKYFE
eukprot:2009078-Prymnesium_polylepis.2